MPYCALFDVPVQLRNMQDAVLNTQDFHFITAVNLSWLLILRRSIDLKRGIEGFRPDQ